MMLSPDAYHRIFLKGKTPEKIMTVIRGLKREIGRLKNVMEHPDYQPLMCPSEDVQISCMREYVERAKKALADAGGVYVPSKAEAAAESLNAELAHVSKAEFSIGGFFGGFKTKTYTVDGDQIHMDEETSFDENLSELDAALMPEINKAYFLNALADLHLGEWRRNYDPSRFGHAILDGTQWHLYLEFDNGHKPVKFSGSNSYPYNFNRLLELFSMQY